MIARRNKDRPGTGVFQVKAKLLAIGSPAWIPPSRRTVITASI
jgi:hypothetical protein